MIRAEITISGIVQGVGFRYFVMQKAKIYGIKGFVKNLGNGKVYCEAESKKNILHDFIKELHIGPPMSRVTDVRVYEFYELKNYKKFEVRY